MIFVRLQAPLSLHPNRLHGIFYIVNVPGGGLGALPQKMFGLNGVKSCNSRPPKKKNENALS